MHPKFAPCISTCPLCNARILQGSGQFSSTAAHVAWRLDVANTVNPQLRSIQIEHGPTTPWSRRIQGGARRATECWRSRICKLAYILISLMPGHYFLLIATKLKACRVAAWRRLGAAGTSIASRTAAPLLTPGCVALFLSAILRGGHPIIG
jgi:hypothetical protein